MRSLHPLICLVFIALAPPTLAMESGGRMTMKVHENIAYLEADGVPPDRLTLDVYTTADAEDRPVIVYLHGGGFRGGDKEEVAATMASRFVAEGYVFIAPNRRYFEMPGPGNGTTDAADSIAWAHANARRYGGNPDRLFLIGYSAGAATAALIATNEQFLRAVGMSPDQLRAVATVDISSFDIERTYDDFLYPRMADILAVQYAGDRDAMRRDSPINHVEPGKHIPDFLIMHITTREVAEVTGEAFAKKLTAAGSDVRVLSVPDRTHVSIQRGLGVEGDQPTLEILAFFAHR